MNNHPSRRPHSRLSAVVACAVALAAAVPWVLGVARPAAAATTTYNSATGAFTINLGDTALLVNGADVTGDVTNNGTLEFGLTTPLTVSNLISGSGNVLLTGTGAVTLSGSNSYSGGTTVRYGDLVITSGGVIYHPTSDLNVGFNLGDDGKMTVSGGTVTNLDGDVGRLAGSTGTVVVNSGTWANDRDLNIGYLGNGSLTISGGRVSAAGTAILGRDAGSSGSLSISGGVLDVGGELQVGFGGAGELLVNGGQIFSFNGSIGTGPSSSGTATVTSGTWTLGNDLLVGYLDGPGTLNISGGGVVSVADTLFRGTNGTINLNSGGKLLIGTGTNSGSMETNLVNNGTVEFNRSDLSDYTYQISGTGNFVKRGDGRLRLTGSNSYSGGTTILGGTVEVASGAWINHPAAALEIGSASGASGGLDVIGGSVAASLLNLYNGSFSMSDGMVATGTAYVGAYGTGTATISGGSWSMLNELYVGYSGTGTMDVTAGSVSSVNTTIGTLGGDSGSLTVTTGGIFNSSGQFVVGGAGTGALTISNGGEVFVTGTLSKGALGTINLNAGGTLNIGSGTGSPTGTLATDLVNNGALVFNRSNAVDYGFAISGTGTVDKRGGGSLSLSGTSSYTGATTVYEGSMYVNGVLGDTAVAVRSGALLGGVGTVGGLVSVESSGTLSPGSLASEIASFKVGSLSLADGARTKMTVNGTEAGLTYDQIAGVGAAPGIVYGGVLELSVSGSYADYTTFHLFSNFTASNSGDFSQINLAGTSPYASVSGSFTFVESLNAWVTNWTSGNQRLQFSAVTGDLIVVPEPGTLVMAAVGVGLGGVLMQRRRQRRRAARDQAAADSRGQVTA
ncbi:MAG: beta strand repeat-containing protein [Planctomycetia bacterium]